MTTCVISQPRFFPPLHYLHRMLVADHFVIFDNVQFNPRHEENRAKLRTPQGSQWLTVPVHKESRDQLIASTRIHRENNWQRDAVRTLAHLYGKTPFYDQYAAEVAGIIEAPHEHLVDLDQASWGPALRELSVECSFVRASALPVTGQGPQLLIDICKSLGADVYLSGPDGRKYIDTAAFAAAGVEVRFHEYEHPVYPQRFGEFMPWLSYLDMLFNAGLEGARVG